MTDLVYDSPEMQPTPQKIVYFFLTLSLWVFWFSLWIPAIEIVGLAETAQFFPVSKIGDELRYLLGILGQYGMLIGVMSVALLAWVKYNKLRFSVNEKRRGRYLVSVVDVAEYFGVETEELAGWRRERVVTVVHDDNGRLVRVERPTRGPDHEQYDGEAPDYQDSAQCA